MEEDDIYAQDNNQTENELSIYEISNSENSSDPNNKPIAAQIYTYSPSDKKLCFIGNDVDHIPAEIIYEFGLKTLVLDISFNTFSDLRDLLQFPYLEELICDNNLISEETEFAKLENLKLFSCNKNQIKDIHLFIDKTKVMFPKLNYLSMLGNVACPNQLVDPSKDEYDYSRYRKYVLHRLRTLKFLDSYEVTSIEKEIVAKESLFYDVVKPKEQTNNNDSKKDSNLDRNGNGNYTPLPNKNGEIEKVAPQTSFGQSKYVYHGKQSEGNRFIRNDDL